MKQFFSDVLELIVIIVLLPFILLWKLLIVTLFFAFLASPLILLGFVIYLIAR